MNILFYIPNLNKSSGGIYQYSLSVLEAISNLDEHTFYVYHPNNDSLILDLINRKKNLILISNKESKFQEKLRYFFTAYNLIAGLKGRKEIFFTKTIIDKLIKKHSIEIIHSPFQFLPEYILKIPGISTMHDVQELKFPEFFTPIERAIRALNYNRTISRSSKIIVSYSHIKKDIIKYFNKNERDVDVCSISLNNLWFENTKQIQKSEIEIELFEEFILYPAATWEHKNHISLLKSLALLNDKGIKVNLICTGHKKEYFDVLNRYISDNNLESQIKFLGAVSEEVLLYLYKHCIAVVIPTLYEAGSFPLMESILLNVPVICSNVTSLPETIGNRDFVFAPLDVEDLSQKIKSIVFDESYRLKNKSNRLRQKAILLSNDFSKSIQDAYQWVTDN